MGNGLNIVAHNLQGMYANRQQKIVSTQKSKSTERLSSGYRINRAADDAAGLSISEKMRKQIRGLTQGTQNAQDGISMCQIADGALAEVSEMMHRLTELSVQSANGTNDYQDRLAIQEEVNALIDEINRVSNTTKFNEQLIFSPENADMDVVNEMDISKQEIEDSVIDPLALEIYNNAPSKYGLAFDEAKKSLLNGTYPQMGMPDEVRYLIADLSTLAIITDNEIYATKLDDSNLGFEEKVSRLYSKETSTTSVIYDNMIGNYPCLSSASKGKMGAGNYYLRLGKYQAAANSYSQVNDHVSYGPYLNMARGMQEYAGNLAWLDYRVKNPSLLSEFSQNTPLGGYDTINNMLGYIKQHGIFSSSYGHDYPAYGYINSIYNSFFDDPEYSYNVGNHQYTGRTGVMPDALDKIVFAYMSFFDKYSSELERITKLSEPGNEQDDTCESDEETEEYFSQSFKSIRIQSGCDSNDGLNICFGSMNAEVLGVDGLDVSTQSGALNAITRVGKGLGRLSAIRSRIGAQQNRLEHTIKNQENIIENTQRAESLIRDTDMAGEMMRFTSMNIIQQAGRAVFAQANQSNQNVLSILE